MPVHGIWSWTLVVIAMPVDTVARAVLNPDDIHHVLDGMMRDVGKQELQTFITSHYSITSGYFDAFVYADQVKDQVISSIQKRIVKLKMLRDVIAADYQHSLRSSSFKDCCRQSNRDLTWDDQKQAFVNYKGMCLETPPWLLHGEHVHQPTIALLEQFVDNFRKLSGISSQYFVHENGLTTVYPVSKKPWSECDYRDMRTRPWYVNAANPPKQLVILIDRSAEMEGVKFDLAKDVAQLLLRTTNHNDKVALYAFNKDEFDEYKDHPCYGGTQTAEQIENQLHFVSSLEPNGTTSYQTALEIALSALANRTKHINDVVVLISGAIPTEKKDEICVAAERAIQKFQLSVMLITVCIDCSPRLRYLMEALGGKGSKGTGLTIDVKSPQKLISSIPLYEQLRPLFVRLADENTATIPMTEPYYDSGHLGRAGPFRRSEHSRIIGSISTLSLPVFYRHQFIGVVAMDISVDNYRNAVQDRQGTYFFLINRKNAMTMYHPMLPQPADSEDPPFRVPIAFLESNALKEGVIDSMKRCDSLSSSPCPSSA